MSKQLACASREGGRKADKAVAHRPAVADELVLYHVLHPTDPNRDEWTQDYIRAMAYFWQFRRDKGEAHLHAEIHRAGQYTAECLQRTEVAT